MSRLSWRWLIFWNWESLTGQVRSLKLSISCFRSRRSVRPGALGRNLSFGSHSSNKFVTQTHSIAEQHHWKPTVDRFLEAIWLAGPPLTLIESDDTWCIVCDMSHCVCQARDWLGHGSQLAPDTSAPHGRAGKQSPEFHFRLFSSLPWSPSPQPGHRRRSSLLARLVSVSDSG